MKISHFEYPTVNLDMLEVVVRLLEIYPDSFKRLSEETGVSVRTIYRIWNRSMQNPKYLTVTKLYKHLLK